MYISMNAPIFVNICVKMNLYIVIFMNLVRKILKRNYWVHRHKEK